MTRSYQLKARAARQDETRRRIVEAAVELHQTVGPVETTMTDVAERAGVGRVTVYRHFADETALARACSGHYFDLHPFPDLDAWRAISDSGQRLRTGLAEAYAWHRETEQMISRTLPAGRDQDIFAPYHDFWRAAAGVLAAGRRGKLDRAAIALALSFETWRTLTRDAGLTDRQAVEVAARLLA